MKIRKLLENEEDIIDRMTRQYPVAGPQVDGLIVRKEVPNTNSISASFNDYEVLSNIRVCTFKGWNVNPNTFFYSADDKKRTERLAMEIKHNGEINPLIMAVNDKDDLWIVEGQHRFLALYMLGKKEFPALIVIDLD